LKAGFEVVEKDVTIKETLQKSLNFLKGLDQLLAEKQNNQKKLPFVR